MELEHQFLSSHNAQDFEDIRIVYQTLALISDKQVCKLAQVLVKLNLYDSMLLQKKRLLQAMMAHPYRNKKEGGARSRLELEYIALANAALASDSSVTVTSNEFLFGFEADIVLRKEGSIVNVELDGTARHFGATSKTFCRLRDEYLKKEHGVHVERWSWMQCRSLNNDETRDKFMSLVQSPVKNDGFRYKS